MGRKGAAKKKPVKPQAQSTADPHPDRYLVKNENLAWLVSVMKKDSQLVPTLNLVKEKLQGIMTDLRRTKLPADESATDLALKRAQKDQDLQGNPLDMIVLYGKIISDGARRRTKLCFDCFHTCQGTMMETMIWAASETASQNAKIMGAIDSRSKHAKNEIKKVATQIADVSSEVIKLAEELADVRAEVDNVRAKLDECNLRLALLPPGYFESRGRPFHRNDEPRSSSGRRGRSQASESSCASNATSVENRIKQAQREAWQQRGSLHSARTHSDSVASEMADPGALSASSSLSMLPQFEPLHYPGTPGTNVLGLSGIPGIQGTSHVPVLGVTTSSVGFPEVPAHDLGCIGVVLAFPEGRSRALSAERVLAALRGSD